MNMNIYMLQYEKGCRNGSNSCKILKEAAEVLDYSQPKIINFSVELSVFPEECKVAKRKPLLKKDSLYAHIQKFSTFRLFFIFEKIFIY